MLRFPGIPTEAVPDRPFHNISTSKSADRRILLCKSKDIQAQLTDCLSGYPNGILHLTFLARILTLKLHRMQLFLLLPLPHFCDEYKKESKFFNHQYGSLREKNILLQMLELELVS